MQGGHAVGERVDTHEPGLDLRCQIVGERLHSRDEIACDAHVEEQVERDCQRIDVEHRQEQPVGHPAVVEINKVERRHVGHQHVSRHVEVGREER